MVICILCKKNYDNDQLLNCDKCQGKICINCSKLTASEMKCMELRKARILKFYCKICGELEPKKGINEEIRELKTMIFKQSNKIDSLTEELHRLTKKLEKVENQNEKQNTEIETALTEIKNNVVIKPLYTQTVAGNKSGQKNVKSNDPILIVKPKEVQGSDKTKKEIKEKIDPTRLGAGVSGMKEISRGQVVIRCGNKDDREKIQNKIHEEMSSGYEIKTPNLKLPKIKVIGINEDDDDTDKKLIEAIIDQNLTNQEQDEEGFHLKILKRLNKKDRQFTLILETDPKTHIKLLNKNKIFIGWSRGKAYDYVHVIRCYKCLGFNHFAKDCQKNKLCSKCSWNMKENVNLKLLNV